MTSSLDDILKIASRLVQYETHPDEVTRWHLVMQQINRKIEEKTIKIRKEEKRKRGKEMNKFDRIGDWRKFSAMMEKYIEGPQAKYGSGGMKFNDFCHYTGLRIFLWNMLKYPLRLWNGFGKEHDFEKTAHYTQMAWTLKERQKRKAPFFKEDIEGDYVVPDIEDTKKSTTYISDWDFSKIDLNPMREVPPFRKLDHYYEVPEGGEEEKNE